MQFIESTNFFLRTVQFDFVNRAVAIKLRFRLVPMFHIGTADYYRMAFESLNACDEVFYEGCKLKGMYLLLKQRKRRAKKLGLVTQKDNFNYKGLKEKLIHADLDKAGSAQAWKQLSWKEKIRLLFEWPFDSFLYGRQLDRARLAKSYMTSAEESYLAYGPVHDEKGTVENIIHHQREQVLFDRIHEKLSRESEKNKTIGIMYGAGHMNNISRFLIDQYHFVPGNGKFLKVFDVR